MNDYVRRPEAVIFDLDGTLIDTAEEFVAVVQQMRANHGLSPMDQSVIRKSVSNGSGALVTLALGIEASHPEYEDYRSEFLNHYEAVLGHSAKPYPGIQALVTHLGAEGIPWGVVTNKFRRFAEPLMNAMVFRPPAQSLITPCDVVHAKPHPEPILLGCKQLSALPQRTIYIGDHKRDIDAGRRAGCFTIAATYGYIEDGDDPATWQADASVDSSEALLEMIMRMIQ